MTNIDNMMDMNEFDTLCNFLEADRPIRRIDHSYAVTADRLRGPVEQTCYCTSGCNMQSLRRSNRRESLRSHLSLVEIPSLKAL